MSSLTRTEDGSKIDRVRARMTRLMHLTREPTLAPPLLPTPATPRPPSTVRPEAAAPGAVADSLLALQAIMRETDELIRQGWEIAVDLNQVRRLCRRCDAVGPLCEAMGSYQGLLNRLRHNEQAANRALRNLASSFASGRHDAASSQAGAPPPAT